MNKFPQDNGTCQPDMVTFAFNGKTFQTRRLIGDAGNGNGPTIVFTGGIHGNEPTGVLAIKQIFEELERGGVTLDGRMVGLVGNMAALETDQRCHRQDLNRVWTQAFLKRWAKRSADSAEPELTEEAKEQAELFELIEPFLLDPKYSRRRNAPPKLYFADLHTTSSKSAPFIGINDQIDNRSFALKFPVPKILGIEEHLEGPLLGLLNDLGHVSLTFEAGQHRDPNSLELHKAFVYSVLVYAGLLKREQAIDLSKHRQAMQDAGDSVPGIYEVVYRKPVAAEDQFKMEPGFANFSKIDKGQILAADKNGTIKAHRSGRIFMPLYQATGNDGFFIVRRVPAWALTLSRFLRRVNFERLLVLLPGISRSKTQPETVVVNKRIAKFLAIELFHLLGYRRKQDTGDRMIFSRREIEKDV